MMMGAALAVSVAAARAQEAAELLAKAVGVHGGAELLNALPPMKKTGTLERAGGQAAGLVVYERRDGGFRRELTLEWRGQKIAPVFIYDGKIHKRKWRSTWDDLPLDEPREEAAHRLGFLVTAAASDRARIVGPSSEAGVDVWNVAVPDGRGEAVLSLAKDDGRLVAISYPATEAEGMGTKKEVTRKVIYRDHRSVKGLLLAFDEEPFHDGEPQGRVRLEHVEVLPEFDDAFLKVPDPRRRFIPSEELAN